MTCANITLSALKMRFRRQGFKLVLDPQTGRFRADLNKSASLYPTMATFAGGIIEAVAWIDGFECARAMYSQED